MYIAAFAFVAGITCLQFLPQLPHPLWLVVAAPLAMVGTRPGFRQATAFLVGFSWAWLQAWQTLDARLPSPREGRDLLVQGRVAAMPERLARGVRLRFEIDRIFHNGGWDDFDLTTRLNWYRPEPVPGAGEYWQFRVRLKQPHGFLNPGGFDYEGWLYRNGIRATGYVRESQDTRRLNAATGFHTERLREALNRHLQERVPEAETRALLQALVIGKRDEMTSRQWEILRRTGTGHLMAISGLHIGLIAGLVFIVTRRIWPLLPGRLALYMPAPRAAALFSLLAAFGYALIAGFSVPTQRAVIMVGVICLAQILGSRSGLAKNLVLAMLVVLLYDSATVLSPGFLLSFSAVAWIAYGTGGVAVLNRQNLWKLRALLRIQWQLALGLLPLTLVVFQQVAWLSPLANLLAVPWMSIAVVPTAVFGTLIAPVFLPLADFSLSVARISLSALWNILESLTVLPGSLWEHAPPPVWTWLTGLCGILLLLAPRGIPARWLGLILLLPALTVQAPRPAPGEVWLTLLDVGQGLAAVVETHGHVLVFDTGPRWRTGFDTGRAVVAPFLVSRGWKKIDLLVVSHGDNDHIGGVRSLLARLPATQVVTSALDAISLVAPATACRADQSWHWDGVTIRFLYPAVTSGLSGNDGSCVLRVDSPSGGSILLTGDIERPAERILLEQREEQLKTTVLVAPHHGSRTSSTPEFVASVAPEVVLIPAGYRNRFGFPHPDVVERYARSGAYILDTGDHGAIQVRIPRQGGSFQISAFRNLHRRFWHNETVPKRDRNPYDMGVRSGWLQ